MGDDLNEPKTISISIPMWMYNWLEKEGKQINRSKLFREAVEFRMKPQIEKVSPVMFLVSIFGICFSIALIGIGVTPSPIDQWARALLALLGGVMAVTTSLVYYRARKEVSNNNKQKQ